MATARYELIASIAKCSEMQLLRVECMIDSFSTDITRKEKRECEEVEEGDREISDRHKDRLRGDHQNLPRSMQSLQQESSSSLQSTIRVITDNFKVIITIIKIHISHRGGHDNRHHNRRGRY